MNICHQHLYDVTFQSFWKIGHLEILHSINQCLRNNVKIASWRRQEVHNDPKKYGKYITLTQVRHDIKKSTSWRQQGMHNVKYTSWRQIACHYIEKYVMTSNSVITSQSIPWPQKVCMTSKSTSRRHKYVMTLRIRHDVKMLQRDVKITSCVKKYVK